MALMFFVEFRTKILDIMRSFDRVKAEELPLSSYPSAILRGAGQVMFQGRGWCGALFLLGILWGSWFDGRFSVGVGALVGLAVSTITGHLLGLKREDGEAGLWGFNGVLVGCAIMTFLRSTPLTWLLLIFGASMTVWVREGLNRVMAPWRVNSFTMPFVLTTWLLLAAARSFKGLPPDGLAMPSLPVMVHSAELSTDLLSLITYWLRGISQVFLIDSWVTGLLFLIGLWLSNGWAAFWAALGSAVALAVAIFFGGSGALISDGLYGFSAVLTAIALGAVFYRPCFRSALWTLLGIVATLFVQAAVDQLLRPVGIPSLTFPFCLTTWLFLLPMLKIDSQTPDHTSWYKAKTNRRRG